MIKPFYYLKEIEKYDVKHLALLFGISRMTIWRWENLKDNPLPSHKVNGRKYFVLKEVLEWIKCQPNLIEIYIEFKLKCKK